ncbi:MAG: cytidylyltransferase domain-containing protein, partial [Prochlorococcaceae cyanobacterium]
MNHPTTVVAIPARLESKRLPRKLLADVGGKPLLQRVLERCLEAQYPAAVVLCTDSEELRDKASQWPLARPVPVVMTPASCSSGSERLACALPELLEFAEGGEPAHCWVL